MSQLHTVRPFASDEWRIYKDLRLRALADSPDAFGSTQALEQDRSDLDWSKRLAAGLESGQDLPLLAQADGVPAGLAWGRLDREHPGVANLYQMWVAPDYRRNGLGRMLLEAVIAWANDKGVRHLYLGVTYRDSPAMRLYQRHAFVPVGQPEPLRPGSEFLCQSMRLKLRSSP